MLLVAMLNVASPMHPRVANTMLRYAAPRLGHFETT